MPTSPPLEEQVARVRPGFFSSARTFSLPLGPRIDPDGVRGYYIDLRTKCDQGAFPPDWWPEPPLERPVDDAQWGLGAYERHLAGEGEQWLPSALAVGERLVEIQEPSGGWTYHFPWPHTYRLEPPWRSAMAQGQGASLLVRLHLETGDERFAEAAVRALSPGAVPVAELGGVPFPEE
jgi:hypothetical protein